MADTTFSLRHALLLLLLLIPACFSGGIKAQLDSGSLHLLTDSMEWPAAAYSFPFGPDEEEDLAGEPEEKGNQRRSLSWRRYHPRYYISYVAMSANRVPCPPRSGRSYYTHNCYHARGPVHPYSRGCNAITRCRR